MARIVGAALRSPDGTVYSLPAPARHEDVVRDMCQQKVRGIMDCESGFLLEDGSFLDRVSAARLATETGQCKRLAPVIPGFTDKLRTEDLW